MTKESSRTKPATKNQLIPQNSPQEVTASDDHEQGISNSRGMKIAGTYRFVALDGSPNMQ
jgi:hypothetical protein